MALLALGGCTPAKKRTLKSGVTPLPERKMVSPFIAKAGFAPERSGMSTSEKRMDGIALFEFSETGETNNTYQHPTWTEHGRLGPIIVDQRGNVYTAPVPMINLSKNNPHEQNVVYRIDGVSGEMFEYVNLGSALKSDRNPFGVLGMAYDYKHSILYVSSVYESDIYQEKGKVYSVSCKEETPRVIDSISGIDAIGVGVALFNGQRTLFLGHARSGDIYSVSVDTLGQFSTDFKWQTSIEREGQLKSSRAQKIRFQANGNMLITSAQFHFNLAPRESKKYERFELEYSVANGRWKR